MARFDIIPKSFGLVFEPPQLTLVYQQDGKLRTLRAAPTTAIRIHDSPRAADSVAECV